MTLFERALQKSINSPASLDEAEIQALCERDPWLLKAALSKAFRFGQEAALHPKSAAKARSRVVRMVRR